MISKKIIKSKVMLSNLLITFSFLFFSACGAKLLKPINTPNYPKGRYRPSYGSFNNARPTTIYLKPTDNLQVKSTEKCKIVSVSVTNDSSIIIVATGRNNIAYGRLAKCFVVKGSILSKGYLLGELFSKDSVEDNSLEIVIEKNGKYKFPKW